jgi:hypothetical protein
MTTPRTRRPIQHRGAALLLCLFALLLVSALGMLMVIESGTANRVNANYGSSLSAYYAARSGLEEVRDRMRYASVPDPAAGGLGDLLPQDIAGNAGGVLYVLNPNNGEVVDPTDPASKYFDDQLCHDYASGSAAGAKCSNVPGTSGWALPNQWAMTPSTGPLAYKWVRVNMKTNRIAAPYCVDGTCETAPLDTRVCWDGQTEQLSPGGANPSCDANGMQNVYMLTALGATPGVAEAGARRLLRFEVVAPSIRPAAAVTISGPGASLSPAPTLSAGGIPTTAIDGRVHNLDGSLVSEAPSSPLSSSPLVAPRCSAVAALATDSNRLTRELENALNALRLSIVEQANTSCNADGSSIGETNCTYGLWWVRGTDVSPRFVTTSPVPLPAPTPFPRHHRWRGGNTGNTASTGTLTTSISCNASSTPNCYTTLNLAAPQLMAISASAATAPNASGPFSGNPGNQADPVLYQPALQRTLGDEIIALTDLVSASANQENFFPVSAASLQSSYGTPQKPAVVVISDTDPGLKLQTTSLSGYGLLVIPSDLEIYNTLQWTGIVLVKSSGQLLVGPNARGSINGALLVQAGATLNLQTSTGAPTPPSSPFRITYSCDAIDLAFQSLPFKIVATSELTY